MLSRFSTWFKEGGFGFTLHVPAWEDSGPFAGAESGYRLLKDVAWYEHATKGRAVWQGGGNITSDVLLRTTYRSRRRVDLAVTMRPEPVEAGWAREARWFWHRRSSPAEANYRYCHALDLNSAYAAVAGSLPLPVGEPLHFHFPPFDKRTPGVWLIEPGPWLESSLPAPWADDHRRNSSGTYWVTTPTMERAAEFGVEPIECYTWRESHAYMRPWYELIRDARAELADVGGPALRAVKDIPQRGVGRLASPNRSSKIDEDPLFQPYWSWAVIAECRQRLHRRLSALDVAPVAIDTDCVWFLSSRATPEVLAVRLGLPLGDGLGQFKAVGSCSAAGARAALDTERTSTAIHKLRDLVKQ